MTIKDGLLKLWQKNLTSMTLSAFSLVQSIIKKVLCTEDYCSTGHLMSTNKCLKLCCKKKKKWFITRSFIHQERQKKYPIKSAWVQEIQTYNCNKQTGFFNDLISVRMRMWSENLWYIYIDRSARPRKGTVKNKHRTDSSCAINDIK